MQQRNCPVADSVYRITVLSCTAGLQVVIVNDVCGVHFIRQAYCLLPIMMLISWLTNSTTTSTPAHPHCVRACYAQAGRVFCYMWIPDRLRQYSEALHWQDETKNDKLPIGKCHEALVSSYHAHPDMAPGRISACEVCLHRL